MAALMAVMARTKVKTRPEKKAGTMRGRVIRRKTWPGRPRGRGGLLDGGVDLPQDRHAGLDAHGHVAEDEVQHQDRRPSRSGAAAAG